MEDGAPGRPQDPGGSYFSASDVRALVEVDHPEGLTAEELLRRTRAALAGAGDDPAAALGAIVRTHVLFHLEDQRGTMLGTSELRALEEPVRSRHLDKRHQQQRLFDDAVVRGAELGVFTTPIPLEASRAVVVMCTGVAGWFSPKGPLSRAEIARRYERLALDMVGAGRA